MAGLTNQPPVQDFNPGAPLYVLLFKNLNPILASGEKVRFSSVQRDNALNPELNLRFSSGLVLVQTWF